MPLTTRQVLKNIAFHLSSGLAWGFSFPKHDLVYRINSEIVTRYIHVHWRKCYVTAQNDYKVSQSII